MMDQELRHIDNISTMSKRSVKIRSWSDDKWQAYMYTPGRMYTMDVYLTKT